jgi:hypothetical protein
VADRYLIETSATDGYLLEDGTGVLLLEEDPVTDVFLEQIINSIEQGMKANTAAQLGGVLVE